MPGTSSRTAHLRTDELRTHFPPKIPLSLYPPAHPRAPHRALPSPNSAKHVLCSPTPRPWFGFSFWMGFIWNDWFEIAVSEGQQRSAMPQSCSREFILQFPSFLVWYQKKSVKLLRTGMVDGSYAAIQDCTQKDARKER